MMPSGLISMSCGSMGCKRMAAASGAKAVLLNPWKDVDQSICAGDFSDAGGESSRPSVKARRFAGFVRSVTDGSLSDVGGLEGGASVERRELLVRAGEGRPTGALMGIAAFAAVTVVALRAEIT